MTLRWAVVGAVLGALVALLVYAPASWLAASLASASDQRLLLADARGSVWHGSAVLVLTGGEGSRDASALPGRLQWTLGFDGAALALRATQACCINGVLKLRLVPGLGRLRVELPGVAAVAGAAPGRPLPPGIAPAPAITTPSVIGQWPASWLVGLGTPWNTMQPSGQLQLSSPGLALEQVAGHWRFSGRAVLELSSIGSRLSTLDVLGSYRVTLLGNANGSANDSAKNSAKNSANNGVAASAVSSTGESATLQLETLDGALQMQGTGGWAAGKFRFNGQASAAAGSEAVLGNLLNIIGRRRGAVSVISIG